MAYGFVDTLATPAVQAMQEESGSRSMYVRTDVPRDFDRFTAQEAAFIISGAAGPRLHLLLICEERVYAAACCAGDMAGFQFHGRS